MNAALVLLVITLGFALVVPMVLGVWGNPPKASATRSFVVGIAPAARTAVAYVGSRFRPVAQGLSLKRPTLREPVPSKRLASSRLAFAVIVGGTAFAVLIVLTIRWVTAALEGIVS